MAGIDAFGTVLARESVTPGTYVAIANVTSLSPPGTTRETLDVTAHDSPNGYMEFLGGLKDPGEVSADVNYDPQIHQVLIDDFEVQEINYKITFPGGETVTFPALLTGLEPDAPYDDKLTASLSWKVTGKPVYTP